MYTKTKIDQLKKEAPILEEIIGLKPVIWLNPNKKSMAEMPSFPIKMADIETAEKLWDRFAPFFVKAFPETAGTNGILESPLREISKMRSEEHTSELQSRPHLVC